MGRNDMARGIIRLPAALLIVAAAFLTATGTAAGRRAPAAVSLRAGTASGRGAYLLRQLQDFSQRYLARVAGRDANLPPSDNGHDEFAAQWTHEMLANLRGLPVGVFRQAFPTPGFAHLPASRPGENVVVAVPGA